MGKSYANIFFTKDKGIGCYENFELEPFMIKGRLTPFVADFFGDCCSPIRFYASYNNLNLWCAWQWDGDGTLVVCDGERIAVNHDCKKNYKWNWNP